VPSSLKLKIQGPDSLDLVKGPSKTEAKAKAEPKVSKPEVVAQK
jgi:hypothetical protein